MAEVDPWLNVSGDPGVQTFSIVVGGSVKICHSEFFNGIAFDTTTEAKYAQKGYRIVYKPLGEFIEDGTLDWKCVKYKHNKSGKQIIEFTEDLSNRKSYLVMQGVVVHDHASISMGGPAYATYYSEPTVPTGEEGG